MHKEVLKRLIDTAAGRKPADLVLKNAQVITFIKLKLSKAILRL